MRRQSGSWAVPRSSRSGGRGIASQVTCTERGRRGRTHRVGGVGDLTGSSFQVGCGVTSGVRLCHIIAHRLAGKGARVICREGGGVLGWPRLSAPVWSNGADGAAALCSRRCWPLSLRPDPARPLLLEGRLRWHSPACTGTRSYGTFCARQQS